MFRRAPLAASGDPGVPSPPTSRSPRLAAMSPRAGLSRLAGQLGAVDVLIALAFGTFAVAEELSGGSGLPARPSPALWVAGAAATAVLVLLRRSVPFGVMSVFTAVNVIAFLAGHQAPGAWQWYTQLLFLFTLLTRVPLGSVRGVLSVVMALFFLTGLAMSETAQVAEYAVAAVMAAIAGGAGVAVRRHRLHAVRADERSELLAAQSELLAREAVAQERARIALELHDIIAHSVSVMVMQAGGVRLTLQGAHPKACETLAVIEETGRGAVEELHRMLGLLRARDTDGLTPQPSLARLADLVEQMRASGLTVTVATEGDPVPLPAGLDLSAYRIVQESLTNTLKHAGPTRATVAIAYRPHELALEILDEGPPEDRARPAAMPGGHGLIGMRERVALFRGTFTAGPVPGEGFRVRAVLPLRAR
ncbi:sensor histidine kinase [Sphaerisporangium perillae]|uniref:sensor histidine kinase n=1 Tax=Sphaerisporangium perillae TaxID=2935860 RepID=UPI00200EE67C|nr:sensor histidine kinase [Sphaerisporangium perillae]